MNDYDRRKYGNSNGLNQPSSFNSELLIPAAIIFILSLIYYVYKFVNTQRSVHNIVEDSGNNNQNVNRDVNQNDNQDVNQNDIPEEDMMNSQNLYGNNNSNNNNTTSNSNVVRNRFEPNNTYNISNNTNSINNNINNTNTNSTTNNNNTNPSNIYHSQIINQNDLLNQLGKNDVFIEDITSNSQNKNINENKIDKKSSLNESSNTQITIFVMINQVRHQFKINKTDSISIFIRRNLSDFAVNKTISLITAGKRLDPEKTFNEYSFIQDQVVIHAFITNQPLINNNSGNSNGGNANRSNNSNNNQQSNLNSGSQGFYREEPNIPLSGKVKFIYSFIIIEVSTSVHFYTLIFHALICFTFLMATVAFKKFPQVFTNQSRFLILLIGAVWLTQFSKCIAKVMVYKRIVYS